MRLRFFLPGLGLLVPFIISCGGGGGDAGLSGVMNVPSFVIPAGETRVVTGDLVINSVADLVIEGELKVTPGSSVALYSEGDVKIHGPIGAAPSRGKASRQTEPPDDLVMAGRNVVISRTVEAAGSGADIYITTLGELGTISISQSIITKPGEDSTSRDWHAGDAGDIFIGSGAAISRVQRDGKASASEPKLVTVTANLIAGRGGHGFTDNTGTVRDGEEGLLYVRGTDGGRGGSVSIDSAQETGPTISNQQIVLGRGGNAGSCGSPQEPVRAKSGSNAGEAGQSLQLRLGTEGTGGGLVFAGVLSDYSGEQGLPGNAYAAAGNGGPGARGGDTTVRVHVRSKNADQVHLTDGGNGGAATQQLQNGGRGGNVTVEVEGAQTVPDLHTVAMKNYGNGGAGFGGCSVSPTVRGSDGGEGGYLIVPAVVAQTVQGSFRGGNGADGSPPGAQGQGGTFSKDSTRFPDGVAGSTCSASQVSELKFSETEVSLFTNDEKAVTLTRTGPLARTNKDIQVTVRSQDGRVALVRANNTLAKSHTITWPAGQASLNLGIVGGVFMHDDPDIVATIVGTEFGIVETRLEVLNGQRLTTGVGIQLLNGTVIPAGTVLTYTPNGTGRIGGMTIMPPNAVCPSWHGQSNSSGFFIVDGESAFRLAEDSCGFGVVIQPTGPTTE